MKAGTQNHVKTKRLMKLLDIPLYGAVGILETLWLLCSDCCDEGNVGKFSDDEIADYLGWTDKPKTLLEALVSTGWLDKDTSHRLVVHDWFDHCPKFIKERRRKRNWRAKKASKHVQQKTYDEFERDNTGQPRDQERLVPSIPNPTQPNPTNNNQYKTPELQETIQDWLGYRKELGKPYKPRGLAQFHKQVFERTKAYGEEGVTAALRKAMANGSQGWDFDGYYPKNGQSTKSRLPTPEEDAAWNGRS